MPQMAKEQIGGQVVDYVLDSLRYVVRLTEPDGAGRGMDAGPQQVRLGFPADSFDRFDGPEVPGALTHGRGGQETLVHRCPQAGPDEQVRLRPAAPTVSLQERATVDLQDRPSYEGRLVARQVEHALGYVVRLAKAAKKSPC